MAEFSFTNHSIYKGTNIKTQRTILLSFSLSRSEPISLSLSLKKKGEIKGKIGQKLGSEIADCGVTTVIRFGLSVSRFTRREDRLSLRFFYTYELFTRVGQDRPPFFLVNYILYLYIFKKLHK